MLPTMYNIDCQKACDREPHCTLLSKLEAYNLNSDVINLIKEYLTGRSQCVEINVPMHHRAFTILFAFPSNLLFTLHSY